MIQNLGLFTKLEEEMRSNVEMETGHGGVLGVDMLYVQVQFCLSTKSI